jgi:hypothetical protein
VLSSALEVVQENALSRGMDAPLLDEFFRLLVSEHNLEIDLFEPHPTAVNDWQMAHTKTSFEIVLASQPTPFTDLSFAQRFTAAIEAVGWPVEAFATVLLHQNPSEIATRTNEAGKTALHWAAMHLGEWLRMPPYVHFRSLKIESYATFASDLVRMGADVHALWHKEIRSRSDKPSLRRFDPFVSLLKSNLKNYLPWNRSRMAQAVSRWGQVLVEGGVHLETYIVTENEFLQSFEWSRVSIPYSDLYYGGLKSVKLSITKEFTLAAEILLTSRVKVWKAQAIPVPGAWPTSPLCVDTISWTPSDMDKYDGFEWVSSGMMKMKPRREQIDALSVSDEFDELLNDSIKHAGLERSAWVVTHDDQSPVARVLGQEMRMRHRVSWTHSRRRAPSAPPLQGCRATREADWTDRVVYMSSGWRFRYHKCPLDSRWYKHSTSLPDRRDCMQGRCRGLEAPDEADEEDYGTTFEGWFLRSEDHVHVAKRYAQKFCPERMHIVEETLERATDRARLAMGPKRPEDAGIP